MDPIPGDWLIILLIQQETLSSLSRNEPGTQGKRKINSKLTLSCEKASRKKVVVVLNSFLSIYARIWRVPQWWTTTWPWQRWKYSW